jgi:hypothetical protein
LGDEEDMFNLSSCLSPSKFTWIVFGSIIILNLLLGLIYKLTDIRILGELFLIYYFMPLMPFAILENSLNIYFFTTKCGSCWLPEPSIIGLMVIFVIDLTVLYLISLLLSKLIVKISG